MRNPQTFFKKTLCSLAPLRGVGGLLFLLFLTPFWGSGGLFAQTYPIHASIFAIPPYSTQLSDYYATTSEKLAVQLLNRDPNRATIDIELQLTISTANGQKTQNQQGSFYPTITLTQGITTRLSQDDLAPYLQNIVKQGFARNGLPNGMVEFTVTVLEKYSKKPISQPATARVWLTTQKPPQLFLPANNEAITFREPLNIKFQWTPQHSGISQIEYEFELRELPKSMAAPQSSFLYSPVIYRERLRFTTLHYSAMMPPLDPDKTYGWRVRAIAKDGIDDINLFENNGFSEIWFFKTQNNCYCPNAVKAAVNDRNVELTWVPAEGNSEYVVQYRSEKATSPEWKTVTSTEPKATLTSLQRETTYEYRVGGICSQGSQPVFSGTGKFTVPARDLSNCGMEYKADLSNRELLQELKVGDVVTVGGGSPMTVTKVINNGGSFSGEGWIPLNWVFETKLAIEFDGMVINTDYQMLSANYARGKQNPKKSQIANLDKGKEQVENNTKNGIVMPDLELDFVIPSNPEFTYNEETNELMVFTTDGQQVGVVEMPKNDGKTIFPIIVKDKERNLYKIEEDENGKIVASSIVDNSQNENNTAIADNENQFSEDKSIFEINRNALYFLFGIDGNFVDTIFVNNTIHAIRDTKIPMLGLYYKNIGGLFAQDLHKLYKLNSHNVDSVNLEHTYWEQKSNETNNIVSETTNRAFWIDTEKAGNYTITVDATKALNINWNYSRDSTTTQDTLIRGTNFPNDLIVKINLRVSNSGQLLFKPINNNYYEHYGFDDAMQPACQQSHDYDPVLTIDGAEYYVPWLGVTPNTEATIKLEYTSPDISVLPNSYKIILKSTSGNLLIDNKQRNKYDLFKSKNIIVKATKIGAYEIDAYLLSNLGDSVLIGKLQVECKDLSDAKQIRIIRVKRKDENIYPEVNKEQIVSNLNKLYKQTFVQFALDNSSYPDTFSINKSFNDTIHIGHLRISYPNPDAEFYYIFVFSKQGVNLNNGQAYYPHYRLPKFSLLLGNTNQDVSAHELGHNLGLQHTFEIEEHAERISQAGRTLPAQYSTRNIMDYIIKGEPVTQRRYFFKYQIKYLNP